MTRTHNRIRNAWAMTCLVTEIIMTIVTGFLLLASPMIAMWIHYGLTGNP